MRPSGLGPAVLLVLSTSLVLQVFGAEDLYWEGEEDASNEFLEVKNVDHGITDHLSRLKRQLFNFDFFAPFSSTTSTTEAPPANQIAPDDPDADVDGPENEDVDRGSGLPDRGVEELGEKTLRVTFTVMEPYLDAYSNRDSVEFQNFSRNIGDAVDLLYKNIPGEQKANLVRIQSRESDEFSCKVTLEIVTSNYDDLDRISKILLDHIKHIHQLRNGETLYTVSDADFYSVEINSNSADTSCSGDELLCSDNTCVPGHARCNGIHDCKDGSDELGCSNFGDTIGADNDFDQATAPTPCEQITCPSSFVTICAEQRCDGVLDCPNGDDEQGCGGDTTVVNDNIEPTTVTTEALRGDIDQSTDAPISCPENEFSCDETRCVNYALRCDNRRDCDDGTDELGCESESCGQDDFRCPSNGRCIEASRRCDRVVDCPDKEDERDCECRENEFQCVSDRSCIEERKRCNGQSDCSDGSDEDNCPPTQLCPPELSFSCNPGSSVTCAKRCDQQTECDGGEDEDDCDVCSHVCDQICLEEQKICNGVADCSDGSDEFNCDHCDGPEDFRCDSGECINAYQFCNGIPECTDESDELNCNTTVTSKPDGCLPGEFQCKNLNCINGAFYCDGQQDCHDNSDEEDCRCGDSEWQCTSGTCIPSSAYCDGHVDCPDYSDEKSCPSTTTISSFNGFPGPPSPPETSTSGYPYPSEGGRDPADYGEDDYPINENEGNRPGGGYYPPNRGPDGQGSGGSYRPGQGSDNQGSSGGYRPGQSGDNQGSSGGYRPGQGGDNQGSSGGYRPGQGGDNRGPSGGYRPGQGGDNQGSSGGYRPGQGGDNQGSSGGYRPGQGGDIGSSGGYRPGQGSGSSDGNRGPEYRPNQGGPNENTGAGGVLRPIPGSGSYDGNRGPFGRPSQGSDPYGGRGDNGESGYPSRPGFPRDGCNRNEWRCENGPCISEHRRCDGRVDCPLDSSDEFDCPAGSPVALNLKTYPTQQTVRNGGDVVFQCRDEGPLRAPVRWVREGGRPLKTGSTDRNGRLEMTQVTMADNGVYICQAVKYLGQPNSELRVTLVVDPTPVTPPPQFSCQPYEATCANGQCIPKSAVCNNVYDCQDRSDEDACHVNGKCEPNQFKCDNNKCVLKTWLCDSEDDCGDGSDEQNCGVSGAGQCKAVEFACSSGDQCVPKSFHCDGQSDCHDGSDEIGCSPVYITRPPQPSNVRLNVGDTLTLNCSATGTPTPMISWRRNWGDVPEVCTSENVRNNEQVVGILVCPNMQPEYNGAYSCEALNNKGTLFAVPDAIVFVNKTNVCPSGYFNSEARSERECIRCFCFGESTSCRSADLFTYNMPTPLGEGGTRLVGVKNAGNGDVQLDTSSITQQYYYQPQRNGATITKVSNYNSNWGSSSALPYLTLPETYNGNQLTSYGGHIKYRLTPHLSGYGSSYALPDIIIKGKYQNLVHFNRAGSPVIEARLTPENWQKSSPRGLVPATREDIMMALDNVEMILLRSSVNNAGVNITDFVMESARHINSGLGAASLVEECSCPPGYEGLSCQKCASGYAREQSGRWLGNCVPERQECPPGTYGDPSAGYACRPCPCPLTNRGNQFARTCSIGAGGNVVCDCNPGYMGNNCEYCAPNYIGNPLVVGDSCKPKPSDNCNPVGTSRVRLPDECECKDNVQGRYCDQCKNDSFYLSNDFRQGCALCFCSGVSQQCKSSTLRRKTTSVRFNTPDLVNRVKVYSSTPLGAAAAARYNAPVETNLTATFARDELVLTNYDRSRPAIYYWSLPLSFAGDKVTSYGGWLTYTLNNVPPSSYNSERTAADIQLISENHLTFHYFGNFKPKYDGTLEARVQLLEQGWQRPDGKEIPRENFLLALADVKALLVKASYSTNSQLASLVAASIETAEEYGDGPPALHVEQCVCPKGYIGTSCEDCAPGYTRYDSGLYLEHCGPCECNGHSTTCHAETGECTNCQDNTYGANCENCKPGYIRDVDDNCVPENPNEPCDCDPRGTSGPCDARGYCECKQNVEGANCDRCRPGTFGLDADYSAGCYSCYCSGATADCHEASNQYFRVPLAAPVLGDNNGGYTLMDVDAQRVISDQIVSMPVESELMYVFPFPPDEELYWSLPVFPGNRVLSYGGSLQLKQKFDSSTSRVSEPGTDVILVGDDKSLYWTNPQAISAGQALNYKVPLTERGWFLQNSATPASRSDFLSVLKNLRRVLVRATLVRYIDSTSIADVSMDTATDRYDPAYPAATGVEICMCPEGYSGTSCESCTPGYYKDRFGCQRCNCNGHDCYQTADEQVVCNCRPPYTGNDCSIYGDTIKQDNGTTRPPLPHTTVVVRITSPTIKIQDIGSSVNFTCQARSHMTRGNLPVTWTKADGYLPQGRTQFDDSLGMIIITNLQISDSGKYICQTTDGISTAQATATLQVPRNDMTMPTVEIRPPINDYMEGERIQLECIASGNPAPDITWQRSSGRALPLYAQSVAELLIIEYAREEDSGEYRCRASNTLGSADRTAVVNVRPLNPVREKLTVSQSAPNLVEGQDTRVVCTGTTNVPAGTIDWVRQDGAELEPNVRSINGVLYINNARLGNEGVYVCKTASHDVQPVTVVIAVIPQGTPSPDSQPTITLSKDRLTIPTGGSGTVECAPSGYPMPNVRWSKYEGQFGDGTSQRGNLLIISGARESDNGLYVCEGTVDRVVTNREYVTVEIERREAPQIEIWPQGEQAVTLDSPFLLRCSVMGGVPEPVVVWSRAGDRPLSQHTQLMPNNVLSFEHIDVNDEGEYSCTATNIAGSATATSTIKVRSKPEVTITPSNYVRVLRGERVTVECRANGYPQPMVSIKSEDMRVIVPPTAHMAVLSIPSASERDDGQYTCSASSLAGTIEEPFIIVLEENDNLIGGEGSGEIDIDPGYPGAGYEQPRDLVAIEGQETRITCASGNLNVVWSRADRQNLQPNARQEGSDLIIRGTSKKDAGQYVCDVYDAYTGELSKSAATSLAVMAAPQITLQPRTQTVHPGESPTVQCIVRGDDVQSVEWILRRSSSRVQARGPTLIFNNIEVEDAGEYECVARNRVANISATAEVVVNEDTERAAQESHDNEQRAHVGAAVQLSCNVQPAVYRVTWTKDGRPVPRSVAQRADGSLYIRLAQKSHSGHYVCNIQDKYGRRTSNYINLHIDGPEEPRALVAIDQPRRQFRVGDNVQVVCRSTQNDVRDLRWERYGTNQFVDSRPFRGGVMLVMMGVQESDAGVYRCTGTGAYGRSSYDDFNLEVIPGNPVSWPNYPTDEVVPFTVRQGDSIDMPCRHNLEDPYSVEWRREYTPLQPEVRNYEPILHLERITEADAGTYICRVSNARTAVESRAILRVTGVVPRFDGSGWISLPNLQDAYEQFDIEVSFKPIDSNGLILYNGEKADASGDYLALQLVRGVPQFVLDVGAGPLLVDGDRPLQLNAWHTIRVSKTKSKIIMYVDNNGPTSVSKTNWELLELRQPLYIGGVPDYTQLPAPLAASSGFIGCVSMLVLGKQEKNIMLGRIEHSHILECDSCNPNSCSKNGVCQEALNERGYVCQCAAGFAGLHCDRAGEACTPGLCGPGKCTYTADGYKCACPVTYTGKNCDVKQSIEYPAFAGSAFLALKVPSNISSSRIFRLVMKVKAASPVTDGIIMYSAESERGYGGFAALTVHDGRLEFTYDVGDGSRPVILTSDRPLPPDAWTDVNIYRVGPEVSLIVNTLHKFVGRIASRKNDLELDTPMFIGGTSDSIVLNKNLAVTGGFRGCIKEVVVFGMKVDLVGSSIQSANVQECSNYPPTTDRGDIPEAENICSQCRNGGQCTEDGSACECADGFAGQFCERRVPPQARRRPTNACALLPCLNGGSCRPDYNRNNFTCDCILGFAGTTCQMSLKLELSVGFNGNGYIELEEKQLRYDEPREPAVVALAASTGGDGVLLYQREVSSPPGAGDFLLIRIQNGVVVMEWDQGTGPKSLTVDDVYISDQNRHEIVAKLYSDGSAFLMVDKRSERNASSSGFTTIMHADSNIYLGGIPEALNVHRYPGLTGCVHQVEFMDAGRGLDLGLAAVTGRNTQLCRNTGP